MAQKPLVAVKARIAELLTGTWMEQGNEPSTVMLSDGTPAARANVMGIVVDVSEGETPSLLIDDGTDRLAIRAFEPVPGLRQAMLGSPVMIIGRPRKFNDTRFLVPECVRTLDNPAWLEVRKRELAKRSLLPAPRLEPRPAEEEPVRTGSPILQSIRALDKGTGADTESVLAQTRCSQEDLERLLVRGEIFEVSPGKLKVLE
ncbi:MAG TPA: hypothetical protein VLJ21_00695 [Candidatus Binatia bacterium]|nr:hypothetical protein [Candidatus Binatia bacterium]